MCTVNDTHSARTNLLPDAVAAQRLANHGTTYRIGMLGLRVLQVKLRLVSLSKVRETGK